MGTRLKFQQMEYSLCTSRIKVSCNWIGPNSSIQNTRAQYSRRQSSPKSQKAHHNNFTTSKPILSILIHHFLHFTIHHIFYFSILYIKIIYANIKITLKKPNHKCIPTITPSHLLPPLPQPTADTNPPPHPTMVTNPSPPTKINQPITTKINQPLL